MLTMSPCIGCEREHLTKEAVECYSCEKRERYWRKVAGVKTLEEGTYSNTFVSVSGQAPKLVKAPYNEKKLNLTKSEKRTIIKLCTAIAEEHGVFATDIIRCDSTTKFGPGAGRPPELSKATTKAILAVLDIIPDLSHYALSRILNVSRSAIWNAVTTGNMSLKKRRGTDEDNL